ncbi:MAG: AAA family ATPase [Jaaginema sp. PMC 1079.18]|nr:AAA family ATPase [Jaaginema sp. PMC 1080.18]MEC4850411.1 AAA family ATPase [Jaaginema sp. PMC 1079.18]MEC4864747.1 AAA family ATPase [Jaaginema sp. PMC 1078.18]
MSFSSIHDLKTLILSFHSIIAIETTEEERVETLLKAVAGRLKLPLYQWTITQGLKGHTDNKGIFNSEKPPALLNSLSSFHQEGIFLLKDFSRHLDDGVLARQFREIAQQFSRDRATLVLTDARLVLPPELSMLTVYYDLKLPTVLELYDFFAAMLQSLRQCHQIQVELSMEEVKEIVRALSGLTLHQARQAIAYVALLDGKLHAADIKRLLDRKAQLLREDGLLEYYAESENTYQLGGFQNLKTWLNYAKVGFTPEARSLNLTPPRGILLVGVQGCGKSLAAKAIAREWRLPLLKLDASHLYDKYIGESEKNLRKAIQLAESMAPAILWIDEIEKGFSQSSRSHGDNGLSQRLFGTLLTWLQEKRQEVFVIATANNINQLPPELLRKGRFDEIFFVDLPDAAARKDIFRIHLSRHQQNPRNFNLDELAMATSGFGGAEIEQVAIASLYRALYLQKPLDTALLLNEIGKTIPLSVSRREDIQRLRNWAKQRFMNAH